MKPLECHLEDTYYSQKRFQTVMNAASKLDKEEIISWMQELLKGNYGFMCQYEKKLNFDTIWSSIFDLQTLLIYRAEGNPRKTKYKLDDRLTK